MKMQVMLLWRDGLRQELSLDRAVIDAGVIVAKTTRGGTVETAYFTYQSYPHFRPAAVFTQVDALEVSLESSRQEGTT
jgi:hypothetical protein